MCWAKVGSIYPFLRRQDGGLARNPSLITKSTPVPTCLSLMSDEKGTEVKKRPGVLFRNSYRREVGQGNNSNSQYIYFLYRSKQIHNSPSSLSFYFSPSLFLIISFKKIFFVPTNPSPFSIWTIMGAGVETGGRWGGLGVRLQWGGRQRTVPEQQ